MEWVETTARTVDEAKERALDQLGVVADEADFEVLAEPKQGLFGRLRGEARVRARVRPAPVRPKQERRRNRRSDQVANGDDAARAGEAQTGDPDDDAAVGVSAASPDGVGAPPDGDADRSTPGTRR